MRRSISLRGRPGHALISNDLGEFVVLEEHSRNALERGALGRDHPRYLDLEARGLLDVRGPTGGLAETVRRTRKSFLMEGPSLHIFVVTLRCDHSCQYCQVSRAPLNATGRDMSLEHALFGIDRVFESDAKALTIEFQGGEPALRFDLVRQIVEAVEAKAATLERTIHFTMASTLHRLSDADFEFCRDHRIHLSTSLDGPASIHSAQRPLRGCDSFQRTIDAIARARAIVGQDGVAALPTITRAALQTPEALVDTYVTHGFKTIFLRPLAPYGFAQKTQRALGYSLEEFQRFYARALDYILALNTAGVAIVETNASIALRHILTPFHSGYMDLRSPAAAGIGVLVYNYDGRVYPSDEARMAAETGDERFALGAVSAPLDALLSSHAMRWLAKGAVAETLPDCAKCAYVPYCGADPVQHAIIQGEPDAPRAGSAFCVRHMALFDLLFTRIAEGDRETLRTFAAWGLDSDRSRVRPGWFEQ